MTHRRIIGNALLAIALAFAASAPASAQSKLSVGPQVSTMGVGLGLSYRATDRIGLSAEYNFFPLEEVNETDDLGTTLSYDPALQGGLVLLTLHPFGGKFALAGGIQIGGASADGNLEFSTGDLFELGDGEYSTDQLESLTAKFTYGDMKPTIMMGWMGKGFNFAFGVSIGSPELEMEATGLIASIPQFQADLDREVQKFNDDAGEIPVYPHLRLGWQFGF
ncbi:MAG: hypothetical protein O3C45_08595 [Bacteroidetes bacterium]|nr:hypothetical protein [Bacteroidota bacterium]MDA0875100.1 hypothetical protein [Bacteroidota bacterium]